MFFSNEVLTKKGPLGIIWLAAHDIRKLKRQQIVEVSIQKSCRDVETPDVPIALRTSGHLLYGIANIFKRKAEILLSECQDARSKIKMHAAPTKTTLRQQTTHSGTITSGAHAESSRLEDSFFILPMDMSLPDFDDEDDLVSFTLPNASSAGAFASQLASRVGLDRSGIQAGTLESALNDGDEEDEDYAHIFANRDDEGEEVEEERELFREQNGPDFDFDMDMDRISAIGGPLDEDETKSHISREGTVLSADDGSRASHHSIDLDAPGLPDISLGDIGVFPASLNLSDAIANISALSGPKVRADSRPSDGAPVKKKRKIVQDSETCIPNQVLRGWLEDSSSTLRALERAPLNRREHERHRRELEPIDIAFRRPPYFDSLPSSIRSLLEFAFTRNRPSTVSDEDTDLAHAAALDRSIEIARRAADSSAMPPPLLGLDSALDQDRLSQDLEFEMDFGDGIDLDNPTSPVSIHADRDQDGFERSSFHSRDPILEGLEDIMQMSFGDIAISSTPIPIRGSDAGAMPPISSQVPFESLPTEEYEAFLNDDDSVSSSRRMSLNKRNLKMLQIIQTAFGMNPSSATSISFDDMVRGRTRHVAAGAFYQLLVLASAGKIHLDQERGFEEIRIVPTQELHSPH